MSNHLELESSPYLLRYKNNPVEWYPWGEKALQRAKKENKAIFLSIGHSSSVWCKTMAQESFTKDVIAQLLNERFIAIKVDKEELPQIAKYYQKVYKLMNRSIGTFPLSIFMTENLEPFYSATYISTQAQQEQLGFEELLRVISKKYITDHETLVKKGHEVLEYMNPKAKKIEATKLHINIINTIELHTENLLDKNNGGFGTAPKFPNTSTLELLLDTYELNKNKDILEAILFSLNSMSKSPLYDHENGGFYSYAKDEKWLKPHLVKTAYDNALLSKIYLRAYQLTNDIHYKNIALSTIDFMINQMSNANLFYSRIDKKEADKTVITSWNSMIVSTLFIASCVDKKYKKIAIKSLETLLEKLYVNKILYHSMSQTSKKSTAFLEDYAYLGEALIFAYQYTLDESYLITATQFSNVIIEQFYEHGQWKFSNDEFKLQEEIYDISYPSSLSTASSLLMSISSLVDSNYKKFVFKTLELNSYNLMRQPLSSPKLAQLLLRYLKDDIVIKSNEKLLEEKIGDRTSMGYPYILFKTTLDENILLYKSSSCLAQEDKFEKIEPLITSYL